MVLSEGDRARKRDKLVEQHSASFFLFPSLPSVSVSVSVSLYSASLAEQEERFALAYVPVIKKLSEELEHSKEELQHKKAEVEQLKQQLSNAHAAPRSFTQATPLQR